MAIRSQMCLQAASLLGVLLLACDGKPLGQASGEGRARAPGAGPGASAPMEEPRTATDSAAPIPIATPPQVMPPPVPASPACTDPGPSPLRRLTAAERRAALRDLLGASVASLPDAPASPWNSRADESGQAFGHNELGDWMSTVETVLGAATRELGRLSPCLADARDDACALAFLAGWSQRALRRPLQPDEAAHFDDVYRQGRRAGAEVAEGLRWAMAAVLSSPQFLYHVELGEPAAPGAKITRLRGPELGARLSFFLWQTPPDERLAQAVASGALATEQGLRAEAVRLLADPRARTAIARLHREWLKLDRLIEQEKDPKAGFTTEVRRTLVEGAERFVDHVFWEAGGRLETLLRSSVLFTNVRGLPALYGLATTAPAGTLEPREAPPGQRAGLLTQPAFLAGRAWTTSGNPVTRGTFVRGEILCQSLPVPPATVEPPPPAIPNGLTTRERLNVHTQFPACHDCHRLIDPLGFGLEHFDHLGVYRTMEAGKPIDASGTIEALPSGEVKFTDHNGLARALARTPEVEACVATQWLRFALGRREARDDRASTCTRDAIVERLRAAGGDMRSLALAIVESPAFTHRRVIQEVTP